MSYSLWGHKESDTTEWLSAYTHNYLWSPCGKLLPRIYLRPQSLDILTIKSPFFLSVMEPCRQEQIKRILNKWYPLKKWEKWSWTPLKPQFSNLRGVRYIFQEILKFGESVLYLSAICPTPPYQNSGPWLSFRNFIPYPFSSSASSGVHLTLLFT